MTPAEALVYAAEFVKSRSFERCYGTVMHLRCDPLPNDWRVHANAMAVEFRSFTLDGERAIAREEGANP